MTVQRVFDDGPFAEIGRPVVVADSEHHGLLAVAGRQGGRQWEARTRLSPHVVGVYHRRDLTCRAILRCAWPVRAVDFHPSLPLLAVGSGRYSGGFEYYGELLLWHFAAGRVVSALADTREIRAVRWRRWREGRVLDVAVAPLHDDELGRDSHTVGYDAMITREDWLAVSDGEIGWRELDGPCRESDDPRDETRAREHVASLSPRWTEHGAVWSVAHLADGAVLASSEFGAPRSWSASGEPTIGVVDAPDVRPVDLPFPVTPPHVPELTKPGPAVAVTDDLGPAVISAVSHSRIGFVGADPQPLRDARLTAELITRRGMPGGEVAWEFVAGQQVLSMAVDAADAVVHLSLANGLLVALDARTGGLLWTEPLVVAGIPSTALALALAGPGRLLVGTAEGRVAECAVPARAGLTAHPGAPADGPVFRLLPSPARPAGLGFRAIRLPGGTAGGLGGGGRLVQE
ncbi:hypothetical protein ACWEOE_29735 [Amycolatopsis sp. NPDC004368]